MIQLERGICPSFFYKYILDKSSIRILMSLYGKTDSNDNVTKAGRGIAASSQAKTIVFVDDQEAALKENKDRGINAPGWWSYYTFTDTDGNVRHKAEMLVTIADPEANADETQHDDAIAADFGITISTQPQDATVSAGDPATFAVVAVSRPTGATLSFQWQEDQGGGAGFADVTDAGVYSDATTATLAISDATGFDGYQYRCVVSCTGAADVTSDTATLTVA